MIRRGLDKTEKERVKKYNWIEVSIKKYKKKYIFFSLHKQIVKRKTDNHVYGSILWLGFGRAVRSGL
jgi:hypothetical protein